MRKGDIVEGVVIRTDFPNKGIVKIQDADVDCIVKGVLPGQKVSVRITKKRSDKMEGQLLEVLEKASIETEPACHHFGVCGGCTYQGISYENQLELKKEQMIRIFKPVVTNELKKNQEMYKAEVTDIDTYFDNIFEGIKGSPIAAGYRNKMEFSFGDGCKGGDLELGLHKKGSFYDIVSVPECQIVDDDYRKILKETLSYFRGKEVSFFHKLTHEGFLRHLLVRKAKKTGQIMICLVTSSQIPKDSICCENGIVEDWLEAMKAIKYDGELTGVLHIINDSLSDVVQSDETRVLYGRDYIEEEVLGLQFRITPFSFFQTNTLSAQVIYETARDYVRSGAGADGVLFDLYSGTGTIAQMLAPAAKKVVGVEIVAEAVEAAKENAAKNGLSNCEFIAGDVLKVLDDIVEKPDFIVLDPPRDGVHPKALRKIIDYDVKYIVYISCKPTSLARDFETLIGCGYLPVKMCCVDQFPGTNHVETVVLITRKDK